MRSVKSIVIAPAKTGKDSKSKTAVIKTDHTNKGVALNLITGDRILRIVVIKLMAPKILETPARCSEKIVKSTEAEAWAIFPDRGGYTVHPVPAPAPVNPPSDSSINAGGSNQNLMLFMRGKAISGAPNISGTSQLPKPPIKIGITIKKIITKA